MTRLLRIKGDTDIAALGALLSDPTRCRVLLALGDGRALSASVLANEAGVAPSTASEHLGKLLDAELRAVESHGRHRYYRLAGPHVGRLLEVLAEHAPTALVRSLHEGTRAHAIRRARYCYDHLGGRLAVALMDALLDRGHLAGGDGRFHTGQASVIACRRRGATSSIASPPRARPGWPSSASIWPRCGTGAGR